MLIGSSEDRNERYLPIAFENEAELEKVVLGNTELLFGAEALLLPKTRISTLGGKSTIPDGIVVDLSAGEWYIVEVELAVHGTWDHIAPQVSRQLASLSNAATHQKIIALALEELEQAPALKERLHELGIRELRMHQRIEKILKSPPIVAIPIDDIPSDLREWSDTLKHKTKIWQIGKYVEPKSGKVLYSVPDEFQPDVDTSLPSADVPQTKFAGGDLFRKVLGAKLLVPGQSLSFAYKPRGKDKQAFTAIVREGGLEIAGRVYSPSYAAVVCIQNAGSQRQTEDGWRVWKTGDGKPISELLKRLPGEDP